MLDSLLELELTAVLAYEAVRTRLAGSARRAADAFLAHERAHLRALERALAELRARPAPRRPAGEVRSGFPPLPTARDALRFALDVEETQVAAYGDSLPTLFTPELRVTVATILAAESEHVSVVLGELDEPPAPRAFVVGGPPAP